MGSKRKKRGKEDSWRLREGRNRRRVGEARNDVKRKRGGCKDPQRRAAQAERMWGKELTGAPGEACK